MFYLELFNDNRHNVRKTFLVITVTYIDHRTLFSLYKCGLFMFSEPILMQERTVIFYVLYSPNLHIFFQFNFDKCYQPDKYLQVNSGRRGSIVDFNILNIKSLLTFFIDSYFFFNCSIVLRPHCDCEQNSSSTILQVDSFSFHTRVSLSLFSMI